jgi:iron complex transport system permease protein
MMVSNPRSRRWTIGLVAGLGSALLFCLSLAVGADDLAFARLFADPQALQLFLASRLPRTLAAVLTGAGLAIAGLIMQTLARNRFVEPATAGTAQSAALGILLATLVFPGAALAVKTLIASAAALIGTSVFLMTAHRLPPTQPFLVPLFGLVYGGVIGAIVTFIGWQADLLQFLDIWTNGEFSGVVRGRYEMLWGAAVMIALAWWVADRLTVVSLGRDVSVGLGLSYQRTLQLGLVIVSVISALTVVIVGIIPFVGLVVPNLVSRLMGDNLRGTIPFVAGSGAMLVLGCDLIGRIVRYPYEIPVATVMGVVGGLLFLRLMFLRSAHA